MGLHNILTIAILTINGREQFYTRLRGNLDVQCDGRQVAIMALKDNRERSIGAKRQLALDRCTTPYIVFIDDDDVVANRYVELVLDALKQKPDGVGFRGIITSESSVVIEFVHKAGLRYSEKPEMYNRSLVYTRPLNHLNPIRTEIARQIGYIDSSFGEDHDYAQRLAASGLVQKAAFIDEFMYFYQYRKNKGNG